MPKRTSSTSAAAWPAELNLSAKETFKQSRELWRLHLFASSMWPDTWADKHRMGAQEKFKHYRELWRLHVATWAWEQLPGKGGPNGRSGHRMALHGSKLLIFGGFNDSGKSTTCGLPCGACLTLSGNDRAGVVGLVDSLSTGMHAGNLVALLQVITAFCPALVVPHRAANNMPGSVGLFAA